MANADDCGTPHSWIYQILFRNYLVASSVRFDHLALPKLEKGRYLASISFEDLEGRAA